MTIRTGGTWLALVAAAAAGCYVPSAHTFSRNYSLREDLPVDPPDGCDDRDALEGGRLYKNYCGACHNAAKARGPANFLKAQSAKDIESDRGLWRNVAAQLRNRTMPPVASKLTEEDRIRVAGWIDNQLRQTFAECR